jgi:hypothetical protein
MNPFYKHISITFLLMMFVMSVHAQSEIDSTSDNVVKKEKKGSIFAGRPGKAMIMSLIIPGTGQIYNKSYLRLPFVYGAVGGMGWYMVYNVQQYNCLKEAYIAKVDGTTFEPPNETDYCKKVMGIFNTTSAEDLRILRDEANVYRQRAILLFALVWMAQGIDAYVDAHLKEFNISDDLSFEITSKSFDDPVAPMRVGLYVNF